MANVKWSSWANVGTPTTGDLLVGLRAGVNVKFDPPTMTSLAGAPLTLAGALTTSGAFTAGFTFTGNTTVTFPTTGTLATTSQLPSGGSPLPLSQGGTGSSLSPVNNATFVTNGSGVVALSTTLPSAVQSNITQLGAQAAALNMNSHLINNVSDPVSAQDAVNLQFLQTYVNGLNPVQGVFSASTANLTGYTYNAGAAGIGATLTAPGNGVFTADGVSPAVGSRFLYKDDTTGSGAYNGIYTITTSSAGAPAVLTRATDYNQPSQINPGDLVSIANGTVNAGSTYVETATIVTVGVTPILFSVFFSASNFLSSMLSSGSIYVGNGSNIGTAVTMSGDATLSNAGVLTIGANKITNAQLAQMAAYTIKGNNTGSSANAADNATSAYKPTFTSLLSGSGNYTTPAGVTWLLVKMVGGASGGSGSGTAGTTASGNGGNTTFGTSLLVANGGPATTAGLSSGGATGNLNGQLGIVIAGGWGMAGANSAGTTLNFPGGSGGSSPLGGAGASSFPGTAGAANSGSGGGGGYATGTVVNNVSGSGGAPGAYVEAILFPTAGQVYAYSVGVGGTAGPAGTNGTAGGAGGSGGIWIEEHYI